MLTQPRKALEILDESSIDRYIDIVVNNPNLGPYNHAYLFNQGNINKFLLPENSIHELGKKVRGVEGEIYLPVFKDNLTFARAKVKEVKPIKRTDVGNNYLTRYCDVFGCSPKTTKFIGFGRLGHFSKDEGEAYISKEAYENQFSEKGMLNKAVLEILAELFADAEDAKNPEYNKLLLYLALSSRGFSSSKPNLNMAELKEYLDETKLMNLSLIVKNCLYLVEGIELDFEEVMILRALMKEDRAETISILEKLEEECDVKPMIKQLRYKLLSTDEATYADLYMLKVTKKLQLHKGFKGFFNTKKYFELKD